MERLPFADEPAPEQAPPGSDQYVRVAVERGIDQPGNQGLAYRAPGLQVGDRVEVPLGRGGTRTGGFVIAAGGEELLQGFDPARVKHVLRATGTRLPPRLIDLARWMASYYVCPLGMVLSTMMPAAVKAGVGRRTRTMVEPVPPADRPTDAENPQKLTPSARRAWQAIDALPAGAFPIDAAALAARIEATNRAPINRLVAAGLLREVEVAIVRAPEAFSSGRALDGADQSVPPTLTSAQETVVEGIWQHADAFGVHLLRGITGSGKTEIYLRLIERVLDAGAGALVLVPEIALTPQTAGRFLARFERQGVAVLHSGLSASVRHKQWAAVAAGTARVVVGARSAIFAPVPDLRLIVVDEEHDGSYKQDQLPRYNARDVAVKRAQMEGCPAVLGSATPSLESWHNASGGSAHYRLWELTERVGGGRLPDVEIVDLNEQRAARRERSGAAPGREQTLDVIGPALEDAIHETLTAGGQAILLLNRRGYAAYIACPSATCGWRMECAHCDASLVLHTAAARRAIAGGYLRCHHCLCEQKPVERCPVCDRRTIMLGAGTQRAEEEIERRLGPRHALRCPDTMLRVDSDTMRSARDYFDALGRFARGEVRVLLGTQMIAKGLDFPNVRLVGVVNADTALHLPDFRASERTFQLVSQVAGRAGRGNLPGRVIVQTFSPHEPALRLAAAHAYTEFATSELAVRRRNNLPPIWRMTRIVVRDPDHAQALDTGRRLAEALRREAAGRITVLGPMVCPIARIAGHHRFAVEMLAPRAADLQSVMESLRRDGLLLSDAHTAVDVDPIALL